MQAVRGDPSASLLIPLVNLYIAERFHFPFPEILLFISDPARQEGRFANVTIRGAGCDGRVAPQDVRQNAYGQAVWSCPPDAGVKLRKRSAQRRRLTSPVLRGERGVSRKAIAQGVPVVSALPVYLVRVLLFLRASLRVRPAPGTPCALFSLGGRDSCKNPD